VVLRRTTARSLFAARLAKLVLETASFLAWRRLSPGRRLRLGRRGALGRLDRQFEGKAHGGSDSARVRNPMQAAYGEGTVCWTAPPRGAAGRVVTGTSGGWPIHPRRGRRIVRRGGGSGGRRVRQPPALARDPAPSVEDRLEQPGRAAREQGVVASVHQHEPGQDEPVGDGEVGGELSVLLGVEP